MTHVTPKIGLIAAGAAALALALWSSQVPAQGIPAANAEESVCTVHGSWVPNEAPWQTSHGSTTFELWGRCEAIYPNGDPRPGYLEDPAQMYDSGDTGTNHGDRYTSSFSFNCNGDCPGTFTGNSPVNRVDLYGPNCDSAVWATTGGDKWRISSIDDNPADPGSGSGMSGIDLPNAFPDGNLVDLRPPRHAADWPIRVCDVAGNCNNCVNDVVEWCEESSLCSNKSIASPLPAPAGGDPSWDCVTGNPNGRYTCVHTTCSIDYDPVCDDGSVITSWGCLSGYVQSGGQCLDSNGPICGSTWTPDPTTGLVTMSGMSDGGSGLKSTNVYSCTPPGTVGMGSIGGGQAADDCSVTILDNDNNATTCWSGDVVIPRKMEACFAAPLYSGGTGTWGDWLSFYDSSFGGPPPTSMFYCQLPAQWGSCTATATDGLAGHTNTQTCGPYCPTADGFHWDGSACVCDPGEYAFPSCADPATHPLGICRPAHTISVSVDNGTATLASSCTEGQRSQGGSGSSFTAYVQDGGNYTVSYSTSLTGTNAPIAPRYLCRGNPPLPDPCETDTPPGSETHAAFSSIAVNKALKVRYWSLGGFGLDTSMNCKAGDGVNVTTFSPGPPNAFMEMCWVEHTNGGSFTSVSSSELTCTHGSTKGDMETDEFGNLTRGPYEWENYDDKHKIIYEWKFWTNDAKGVYLGSIDHSPSPPHTQYHINDITKPRVLITSVPSTSQQIPTDFSVSLQDRAAGSGVDINSQMQVNVTMQDTDTGEYYNGSGYVSGTTWNAYEQPVWGGSTLTSAYETTITKTMSWAGRINVPPPSVYNNRCGHTFVWTVTNMDWCGKTSDPVTHTFTYECPATCAAIANAAADINELVTVTAAAPNLYSATLDSVEWRWTNDPLPAAMLQALAQVAPYSATFRPGDSSPNFITPYAFAFRVTATYPDTGHQYVVDSCATANVYVKNYELETAPATRTVYLSNTTSPAAIYEVRTHVYNQLAKTIAFTRPVDPVGSPAAVFTSDTGTPVDLTHTCAGIPCQHALSTGLTYHVPTTEPPATPYQLPAVYSIPIVANVTNDAGYVITRTAAGSTITPGDLDPVLDIRCPNDSTGTPNPVVLDDKDGWYYWMRDRDRTFTFEHVTDTTTDPTVPKQCLLPVRYEVFYGETVTPPGTPYMTIPGPVVTDLYPTALTVTFSITDIPDGHRMVWVRAVDAAGNALAAPAGSDVTDLYTDNVEPNTPTWGPGSCVAPNCVQDYTGIASYYFANTSPGLSSSVTDDKPSSPAPTPAALGYDGGANSSSAYADGVHAQFLAQVVGASGTPSLLSATLLVPDGNGPSSGLGSGGGWSVNVSRANDLPDSEDLQTWTITPQVAGVCPATPSVRASLTPWDSAGNGGAALISHATLHNDLVEPVITEETYLGVTSSMLTTPHPWRQDTAPGDAPILDIEWSDRACASGQMVGMKEVSYVWEPTVEGNSVCTSITAGPTCVAQTLAPDTYANPGGGRDYTGSHSGILVPFLTNRLEVTLTDKLGNTQTQTALFRRCYEDTLGPDAPVVAPNAVTTWQRTPNAPSLTVANPAENAPSTGVAGSYPSGIVPAVCKNTLKRYFAITLRNTDLAGGTRVSPTVTPDGSGGFTGPGGVAWVPWDIPVGSTSVGTLNTIPVPAPSGGWTNGWYSTYLFVTDTSPTQENPSVVSAPFDTLIDTTAPTVDPFAVTNCGGAGGATCGSPPSLGTYYFSYAAGVPLQMTSTVRDTFPGGPLAAILPGGLDPTSTFVLDTNATPSATLTNDTALGPIARTTAPWTMTVQRASHTSSSSTDTQSWSIGNSNPTACPAITALTGSLNATDQATNTSGVVDGGVTLHYDNRAPLVMTELYDGTTRSGVSPDTSAIQPAPPALYTHPWTQDPPGGPPNVVLTIRDQACTAASASGVNRAEYEWTPQGSTLAISTGSPTGNAMSAGPIGTVTPIVFTTDVPLLQTKLRVTSQDFLGAQRTEEEIFQRCLTDTLGPTAPVVTGPASLVWRKDQNLPATVTLTSVAVDQGPVSDPTYGTYPGGVVPVECTNALKRYLVIALRNTDLAGGTRTVPTITGPDGSDRFWTTGGTPVQWTEVAGIPAAGTGIAVPAPAGGWQNGWYSLYLVATDTSRAAENIGLISAPVDLLVDDDEIDVVARPVVDPFTVTNCGGAGGATCRTGAAGTYYFSYAAGVPLLMTSTVRDRFPGGPLAALFPGGLDPVSTFELGTNVTLPATLTNDTTLGPLTRGAAPWTVVVQRASHDSTNSIDTQSWSITNTAPNTCPATTALTGSLNATDQATNTSGVVDGGVTLHYDNRAPLVMTELYDGVTTTGTSPNTSAIQPTPPVEVSHPWTQDPPGPPPATVLTVRDQACNAASASGVETSAYAWTITGGTTAISVSPASGSVTNAGAVGNANPIVHTLQVPLLQTRLTVTSTDYLGRQRVESEIFQRCLTDTLGPTAPVVTGPTPLRWKKDQNLPATVTLTSVAVDQGPVSDATYGSYPGGVVPVECTNALKRYFVVTLRNAADLSSRTTPTITGPDGSDRFWTTGGTPVQWTEVPGIPAAGGTITVPAPAGGWENGWYSLYLVATDTSRAAENIGLISAPVDLLVDDDEIDVAARPTVTAPTITAGTCPTTGDASCYTEGAAHYVSATFDPTFGSAVQDLLIASHSALLPGGLDAISSFDVGMSGLPTGVGTNVDPDVAWTAIVTQAPWRYTVTRTAHDSATSRDTQSWTVVYTGADDACPVPADAVHTLSLGATDQAGNVTAPVSMTNELRLDAFAPRSSREWYIPGVFDAGPIQPAPPAAGEHPWTQVAPLTSFQVTDQSCSAAWQAGVRSVAASWDGAAPVQTWTYSGTSDANRVVTTNPQLTVPWLEHTLTLTSRDKVGNTRVETSIYRQCYEDDDAPTTPTVDSNPPDYSHWTDDQTPTFTWTNPADLWPTDGVAGQYPAPYAGTAPPGCQNDLHHFKVIVLQNPDPAQRYVEPADWQSTIPDTSDPRWVVWPTVPPATAPVAGETSTFTIPFPIDAARTNNDGWHAICVVAVDDAPTGANTSDKDPAKCVEFFIDSSDPVLESLTVTCPTCVQLPDPLLNEAIYGDPTILHGGTATLPVYYLTASTDVTIETVARDGSPRGFNAVTNSQTMVAAYPVAGVPEIYNVTREQVDSDDPQVASYATTSPATPPWEVTAVQGVHATGDPSGPAYARATWSVGRRDDGSLPACAYTRARLGVTVRDQASNLGGPMTEAGGSVELRIDAEPPEITEELYDAPATLLLPNEHAWSRTNATRLTLHDPACDDDDGVGVSLIRVVFVAGDQPIGAAPANPRGPGGDWSTVATYAVPELNPVVNIPIPDRVYTMFLYMEDAVGNSTIVRSLYRVDRDEPQPCTLRFTIDDTTHEADIHVAATDAVPATAVPPYPGDTGSGVNRFEIFRTVGPDAQIVTPLHTIQGVDVTRGFAACGSETVSGMQLDACGDWTDDTLEDLAGPLPPTALDVDGSPTHDAVWSLADPFALHWQVHGSTGTQYNYGVICIDEVDNPQPRPSPIPAAQQGTTSLPYRAPEVMFEVIVTDEEPPTGVPDPFYAFPVTPPRTLAASRIYDAYRDVNGVPIVLEPDDSFRLDLAVQDASGTCPDVTYNAAAPHFCLPSGHYRFAVTSYVGNDPATPHLPLVGNDPPLALGPFRLDVTDPTWDAAVPFRYPDSPDASPGPYGTPFAGPYATRLFFWNGETDDPSTLAPVIHAAFNVSDAHSGLSQFRTWEARWKSNPFGSSHSVDDVLASGTIDALPRPPEQRTDTRQHRLELEASGDDAPAFGDHVRIGATAHDDVLEDPKNRAVSPESAVLVYDDREPVMSCRYVEINGERTDFIVIDPVRGIPEVSVNTEEVDVIVEVTDEQADPTPATTLREVRLDGRGALTQVVGTDLFRITVPLNPRRNSLVFQGIDYAGNLASLPCDVVYFPEVHIDVKQSASQSGTLTRKQSDNAEEPAMDRVTFTTTVSVPGAAGLLATYFNHPDGADAHAVTSEMVRDPRGYGGLAYTLPAGPAELGDHQLFVVKAGNTSLEQYAVRFEGRVSPPTSGDVRFALYLGEGDRGTLALDPQTASAPVVTALNSGDRTPDPAATYAECGNLPHHFRPALATEAPPVIFTSAAAYPMQAETWYGIVLTYEADAAGVDVGDSDTVGLLWMPPGATCYSPVPKDNLIFPAAGISDLVEGYTVEAKLPPGFLVDRVEGVTADTFIPDVRVRPAYTDATFPYLGSEAAALTPERLKDFQLHVVNDVTTIRWAMPEVTTCELDDPVCNQFTDGRNFLTRIPVGRALTLTVNAHATKAFFLPTGTATP